MALATWWSSDPLPDLPVLPGFQARAALDEAELARLNRLSLAEVQARRQAGHRPYLGYLQGVPVAYGWVATEQASIGELELTFILPAEERYLWDFATLPEWQGRGIYPHLLQAILAQESVVASRFWIIYAPENLPSGAGMDKAGFWPVGQLSFRAEGGVGLAPFTDTDPDARAQAGARLLGVSLVETVLAPCWHCGGLTEQQPSLREALRCWPPVKPQAAPCSCATPVKPAVHKI